MKVLMTLLAIGFSAFAPGALGNQLGKTYPVLESDTLQEISAAASAAPQLPSRDITKTTAFKGFPLPSNKEGRTRTVTPFYRLEFAITDASGKILYPEGFTFNVAEYVRLPFRVVVFSSKQIEFVKALQTDTDVLILSEGEITGVAKLLGRPVYYLDHKLATRLFVTGVPSVIRQIGTQYEISEFKEGDLK